MSPSLKTQEQSTPRDVFQKASTTPTEQGHEEYLKNKKLSIKDVPGIRFGFYQKKPALLVPLKDSEENIKSIQYIYKDDEGKFQKKFAKDCSTSNNFLALSDLSGRNQEEVQIFVTEGIATAASLKKIIEHQPSKENKTMHVVCSFSSANLPKVAKLLKDKFKNAKIVAAPDCDEAGDAASMQCKTHDIEYIFPEKREGSHGRDWSNVYMEMEGTLDEGCPEFEEALKLREWLEGRDSLSNVVGFKHLEETSQGNETKAVQETHSQFFVNAESGELILTPDFKTACKECYEIRKKVKNVLEEIEKNEAEDKELLEKAILGRFSKDFKEAEARLDFATTKRLIKEYHQALEILNEDHGLERGFKPKTRADHIAQHQDLPETIYTGYDLVSKNGEDVKIEFIGGTLSLLAAQTSHGKTMTLVNFALGALERHPDKVIYFFTYEESEKDITNRFLNAHINEKLSKNNRKTIEHYFKNQGKENRDPFKFFSSHSQKEKDLFTNKEEKNPFSDKEEKFFKDLIESGRLRIVNFSDCSHAVSGLTKLIRNFHEEEKNLGLVCIDYIQMLSNPSDVKKTNRQEELKAVCLELHKCAAKTGVPLLIASQFNRNVQAKEDLNFTNIGEAGDIERISSLVLGLWNSDFLSRSKGKIDYDSIIENTLYFEVLKGRHIGIGYSAKFKYDGNSGKINNQKVPNLQKEI